MLLCFAELRLFFSASTFRRKAPISSKKFGAYAIAGRASKTRRTIRYVANFQTSASLESLLTSIWFEERRSSRPGDTRNPLSISGRSFFLYCSGWSRYPFSSIRKRRPCCRNADSSAEYKWRGGVPSVACRARGKLASVADGTIDRRNLQLTIMRTARSTRFR